MRKLTTTEQINKASVKHNNMYDYSLVEYKNSRSIVKIVCPIHGEFEQQANSHLQGKGCSKCKGLNKLTTNEFIKRANVIHNNKYDYSLVQYDGNKTKIDIICPIHGIFKQTPNAHLSKRAGCPICKGENHSLNTTLSQDQFITKANKVHDNKYDYSLVKYIATKYKVIIICPIHGEFEQRAGDHLNGHGCSKCTTTVSKPELEICEFLSKHNIEYNQSNRSLIKPYELDIIIPSVKLAIEFDGTYWHSDEMIKIHRGYETADEYHQMKTVKCNDIGQSLLHIFEDDQINNKNNELNKILEVINK